MEHPLLYQINTRCWLRELSKKSSARITLANVPDTEFRAWPERGFTHVWLMGVWTTGARARALALNELNLRHDYNAVLPDWNEADVAGSPYAIADYQVPRALGGERGLKAFRQKLNAYGLKLVLDFVGNHLGLDHPWVARRPELFVHSVKEVPESFPQPTCDGPRWLAHGKDPYFSAWTDTVQLDYRRAETRLAMTEVLQSIAARCDGVRCDMAMLMLNDVFAKTWAHRPNPTAVSPNAEFWAEAIQMVRQSNPGFQFLAEVYWGLEGRMQSLGFDYTYDKALYDLLMQRRHAEVQQHLLNAPPEYVAHSAHFLENHDEPRAASRLSFVEHRAASLLILGLPGLRFLHDGQLTGAMLHVPVQLSRRRSEPGNADIGGFYERLLAVLKNSAVGRGKWELLRPRPAWPENSTWQNFVLVQWQSQPLAFDLVVVNPSPQRAQCYAPLSFENLADHNWRMRDLLGHETYERWGEDLQTRGLYLDLPEHGAQLFRFEPIG